MELPIGYQQFHSEKFFNYQMNRLHALGYAEQADIERAAKEIKSRQDYVKAFKQLALEAKAAGRLKNAASYLRAAEFFVEHNSPERREVYQAFSETFYAAFADEEITRHKVPYQGSFLPVMELASKTNHTRGTILLFGGFDSLIEEFFVIWKFFAERGYRVIAFEGPGQGGARQMYDLAFDHDWEKPTGAILDYLNIEEAALIGISMGGYWAIRAAAYESRIQQVVAWSPVYDWMEQIPGFAQAVVRQMAKWKPMMNATIRMRMRLFPILDHAVRQAMYMIQKDEPIDAVYWLLGMNRQHISSERVTQDVLLVGGENDAFQPIKLLHKQREALTNARSVSTRIFTSEEHADQHCQMGNLNLAMGEIESWLQEKVTEQALPIAA